MEMLSLKGRLAKLLDVKSLVTFLMSAVFAALALRGDISGQEFQTVFTVVIGFYFGTQAQKQSAPLRESGRAAAAALPLSVFPGAGRLVTPQPSGGSRRDAGPGTPPGRR